MKTIEQILKEIESIADFVGGNVEESKIEYGKLLTEAINDLATELIEEDDFAQAMDTMSDMQSLTEFRERRSIRQDLIEKAREMGINLDEEV